jgi:delta 1-pyrroline-5-carboxylate dehydrogenase
MDIVKEETFGPIVAIMKFRTEDEAIALANDSPYGLSSSVWTADLQRAARVARRIETGSVSVNNALATLGNAGLPFGGVKDSGIGRYKSAFGLYSFSNIKAVMFDTQSNKIELNWYPYSRKKYKLMGELLDVAFNSGLANLLRTAWVGIRLELLSRKHRL